MSDENVHMTIFPPGEYPWKKTHAASAAHMPIHVFAPTSSLDGWLVGCIDYATLRDDGHLAVVYDLDDPAAEGGLNIDVGPDSILAARLVPPLRVTRTMSWSSRYRLHLAEPAQFTATGLDAAHRVARRVQQAIREALLADPEVIAVERDAILREGVPRCTGKRGCPANLHDLDCPERHA